MLIEWKYQCKVCLLCRLSVRATCSVMSRCSRSASTSRRAVCLHKLTGGKHCYLSPVIKATALTFFFFNMLSWHIVQKLGNIRPTLHPRNNQSDVGTVQHI